MGMLRNRIESRVNFVLNSQGQSDEYQELSRMLELVKNGELILNELSGKMESARFLEEFVVIINGAAESMRSIKGDMEHLAPLAESALDAMQDVISKISTNLSVPDSEPLQGDLQDSIIAEATAAAEKTTATDTWEEKDEKRQEEGEIVQEKEGKAKRKNVSVSQIITMTHLAVPSTFDTSDDDNNNNNNNTNYKKDKEAKEERLAADNREDARVSSNTAEQAAQPSTI
jgi:hypothetical protein